MSHDSHSAESRGESLARRLEENGFANGGDRSGLFLNNQKVGFLISIASWLQLRPVHIAFTHGICWEMGVSDRFVY